MTQGKWMIYGAYGYTGKLVADEALRRGHSPILAGRAKDRIAPLGSELRLPARAVALDSPQGLREALADVDAVIHTAGPFAHTSEAMVEACLDTGTHYLDVTGEVEVFERIFRRDAEAKARGIALLPGVGFDVVPSDCLAAYVAQRVPSATHLELAILGLSEISPGTAKSTFEGGLRGGLVRRDGKLVTWPHGRGVRMQAMPGGERPIMPIPWGDLETAFHSTGIPNITTYMAVPRRLAKLASRTWRLTEISLPAVRAILGRGPLHTAVLKKLSRIEGPDADARRGGKSHVWAKAWNDAGDAKEAWLTTVDGYAFTAASAVRCLEAALERRPSGALSPAMAFGPDFVLDIPGTMRMDALAGQ